MTREDVIVVYLNVHRRENRKSRTWMESSRFSWRGWEKSRNACHSW